MAKIPAPCRLKLSPVLFLAFSLRAESTAARAEGVVWNPAPIPKGEPMTMTQAQPASQGGLTGPSGRKAPQFQHINVGGNERLLSALGGSLLAYYGLRRFSIAGLATAAVGGGLLYRGVSGHCPAYDTLGKSTAGEGASPEQYFERGIHVVATFTVNKPAEELYRFWRNFENLPKFMTHVQSVSAADDKRSHWVVDGPAGKSIHWDAEVINDEPNRLIAWRSLGGADVDNAGSVNFTQLPHDRGTEVKVVLDYIPPAGKVGATLAW